MYIHWKYDGKMIIGIRENSSQNIKFMFQIFQNLWYEMCRYAYCLELNLISYLLLYTFIV